MKISFLFISAILFVLIVECFAHDQIDKERAGLWSNHLRITSWTLMGIWFYQLQKCTFKLQQKLLLLSVLFPIVVSLTSYLLPERQVINIGVNTIVFLIWIYCFHAIGAKISLRDYDNNFKKIVPAFLFFPLCFYFLSLYADCILS